MDSLKKCYAGIILIQIIGSTLSAEEVVCPRCEEIRKYNATHHKNYEYFEEYLKDQKDEGMCKPVKKSTPREKNEKVESKS